MKNIFFLKNITFLILVLGTFTVTPVSAEWKETNNDLTFSLIIGKNNHLIGITKTTRKAFLWQNKTWRQLNSEEMVHAATNGKRVIGIKKINNWPLHLFGKNTPLIAEPNFLFFDTIALNDHDLVAITSTFYKQAYRQKSKDLTWSVMGPIEVSAISVSNSLCCAIERNVDHPQYHDRGVLWHEKNSRWQPLGSEKITQIIADGSTIIALQKSPFDTILRWNNTAWMPVSKNRFAHIACDKGLLCGVDILSKKILVFEKHTWQPLGNKTFVNVATDGTTIYGLDHQGKVYFWQK